MNGDVFAAVQFRERPHWPYALQLRLIEADQVCSPDRTDRLAPGKVNGKSVFQIVQGVETNEAGEIVAYWVANRHPLEYENPVPLRWTRVEAHDPETGEPNILCVTQRERAGQRRGVPLLAPALPTLKQMGRYTDAELSAAIVSSCATLFIQRDGQSDAAPFGEDPPEKADNPDTPADELAINLSPAAVFDLAPGEKANLIDPKHPTTTYDGFMMAMSNQVATSVEIPSEVLYKKFSSNYSASRGALNEFWRTCGTLRDSFADDFCQPTYEKWFAEAVARGRINIRSSSDFVIWGNETACYPKNTDPKDMFLCVRRFFNHAWTSFVLDNMGKLDKPMNPKRLQSIIDSENMKGSTYVSNGVCASYRMVADTEKNTEAELVAGHYHFWMYCTPFPPMKQVNNTMEYESSSLVTALNL